MSTRVKNLGASQESMFHNLYSKVYCEEMALAGVYYTDIAHICIHMFLLWYKNI